MTLVIYSSLLAVGFFLISLFKYHQFKIVLKDVQNQKGKMEVTPLDKVKFYLQIGITIVIFVSFFIFYQEPVYLAFGILLFGTSLSTVFLYFSNFRLFYNKRGFLYEKKFVEWKSIKSINKKTLTLRMMEIQLYKDGTLTIDPTRGKQVKDLLIKFTQANKHIVDSANIR